jgi:hypothetical protein
MQTLDMQTKGMPIGRPAEVNLRNNHAQYIFTWYGDRRFPVLQHRANVLLQVWPCLGHVNHVLHGRKEAAH